MEMDDLYDSQEHKEKNRSYFLFKDNMVTCVGVSIKTLLWNYFCWFLAGKPEMKKQEIK